MAHTPGPWTIAYETEDGEIYDDGVRIDSPEGPVAFNVIDYSAHLIAAAPELLAALKQFLGPAGPNGWPCYCGEPDMETDYCDYCAARTAIAKAEGRGE